MYYVSSFEVPSVRPEEPNKRIKKLGKDEDFNEIHIETKNVHLINTTQILD